MKRYLLLLLSLLVSHTYAHEIAKRVITLSPHATELAFSAGLGKNIVGVSDYSDYPPQAKHIERVANYQSLNIERIVALKPDLVIAWPAGNPSKQLNKLKQLGVHVVDLNIHSLDDIAKAIDQLSQFSSDPKIGEQAAINFRQQLKVLAKQYQTQQPVKYFYQLSSKPIITIAKGSWPSEVFSFCGGKNVFANSPAPYPQVGIEQVLLAKPQVIFTTQDPSLTQQMWQQWQSVFPAAKKDNIWRINPDWLNRPTMRTLKAIKQVCQDLDLVRKRS
ncbi:vitamin B12 ABC transporter substrate-binding protein BtuF [Vibrio sp. S4M6]|uniref:vitamin B12 ABC transporter substrate-binding protein BtuF n=1 Tax=Vibrio sinus TaxID=2946865 RepID=UPI002029BE1C|nr:vitamin B12 ABC transporter substrate-binding protein BtuF [Vibrio sinus]MCL9781115.1 vitamin B12 ABC transporter substrate-binding protein BtuF [Vibrio sinus]